MTVPIPPAQLPTAQVPARAPDAAQRLALGLGAGPFAAVVLFISPEADLPALTLGLGAEFGDCPVIGCTTAGEISAIGYCEGEIVAMALPAALFAAGTLLIEDLHQLQPQTLIGQMIRLRAALVGVGPALAQEPALLPPHYTGFVDSDNRFYKPIRDAGLATGKLQARP